eukprot:52080-Eustigmatos_ZCMA.PRE.2
MCKRNNSYVHRYVTGPSNSSSCILWGRATHARPRHYDHSMTTKSRSPIMRIGFVRHRWIRRPC